ncbi:MAG: hypothetical protein ACLR5H_05750 [Oscillospiraceae bacterium]
MDGLSQPRKSRAYILAAMLNKNPRFINEPIYTDALETQAKILLKNYAIGHLLVPGDNRFLSGDLLELLRQLMSPRVFQMPAERVFCDAVTADFFAEDSFYAPGATYEARRELHATSQSTHRPQRGTSAFHLSGRGRAA